MIDVLRVNTDSSCSYIWAEGECVELLSCIADFIEKIDGIGSYDTFCLMEQIVDFYDDVCLTVSYDGYGIEILEDRVLIDAENDRAFIIGELRELNL